MKKLVHPNLIQLYEVIDYDEGDKLYMSKFLSHYTIYLFSIFINDFLNLLLSVVMDYAENGEILKWN